MSKGHKLFIMVVFGGWNDGLGGSGMDILVSFIGSWLSSLYCMDMLWMCLDSVGFKGWLVD